MIVRFAHGLDQSRSAAKGMLPAATLMLLAVGGCGGSDVELVDVGGTVTLDGQPLPNAEVRFLPIVQGSEPARPSYGLTDESGEYELEYSTTKSGARPGKYRVYITTKRPAEPGEDGVTMIPAVPEKVPDVYNTKTTLTAEVTAEERVFNFDLKSDAGQTQPADAPSG